MLRLTCCRVTPIGMERLREAVVLKVGEGFGRPDGDSAVPVDINYVQVCGWLVSTATETSALSKTLIGAGMRWFGAGGPEAGSRRLAPPPAGGAAAGGGRHRAAPARFPLAAGGCVCCPAWWMHGTALSPLHFCCGGRAALSPSFTGQPPAASSSLPTAPAPTFLPACRGRRCTRGLPSGPPGPGQAGGDSREELPGLL